MIPIPGLPQFMLWLALLIAAMNAQATQGCRYDLTTARMVCPVAVVRGAAGAR